MRLLSLTCLALAAIFSGAHGCGMLTHMEVSGRAIEFFGRNFKGIDIRELLRKNADAYMTGSIFPDAYYSPICIDGDPQTKAVWAHGLEFTKTALDYFAKTYIANGTVAKEGEKLLAFILGTIAHDVQDQAWHGFDYDQGFLATMAQVNTHGNFTEAHFDVADWGGDAMLLYDVSFINLHLGFNQWFIPAKDLQEIYRPFLCKQDPEKCEAAIKAMRIGLEMCPRATMLRALMHKILIQKWYIGFAMKSPFLLSSYNDYFAGGMNDLASWTAQRLETALRYLENPKSCVNNHKTNQLFWSCGDQPKLTPPPSSWTETFQARSSLERSEESSENYMQTLFSLSEEFFGNRDSPGSLGKEEDLSETTVDRSGNMIIRPKNLLRKVVQEMVINDLIEFGDAQRDSDPDTRPDQFVPRQKDHYKYFVKKAYSHIGQALVSADLNKDGKDDLVIGVPGYSEDNKWDKGRVFVVTAGVEGLRSEDVDLENSNAVQVIAAPFNGTGRFGYAITALNFNGDDHLDLAISAPIRTKDQAKLPYSGFVYIYFGQENGQFLDKPDVTIDCNMRYCNFGTTLATGDVNRDGADDLIIGSPYASKSFERQRQNGFVAVYFANHDFKHGKGTFQDADHAVWGIGQYSWFGTSAISTASCDLLVGAPGQLSWKDHAHECDPNLQSAGAVYCYTIKHKTLSTFARGSKEFEYFGGSLSEGYPNGKGSPAVVAIGAPHSDNVGKLIGVVPYLNRQSGTVYLYNSRTRAEVGQIQGDRLYALFGSVVKFAKIDDDDFDDLIVSAPPRSPDITNLFYGPGLGQVYLYYGRKSFPTSSLNRPCEGFLFKPCTGDQADGVFETGLRRGHFGSSLAVLRSGITTQLVVAQQSTDDYARQSGRLVLFNNCHSLN